MIDVWRLKFRFRSIPTGIMVYGKKDLSQLALVYIVCETNIGRSDFKAITTEIMKSGKYLIVRIGELIYDGFKWATMTIGENHHINKLTYSNNEMFTRLYISCFKVRVAHIRDDDL